MPKDVGTRVFRNNYSGHPPGGYGIHPRRQRQGFVAQADDGAVAYNQPKILKHGAMPRGIAPRLGGLLDLDGVRRTSRRLPA